MGHLMWILTWIAVGIGGALGAASVIMLTESHQPGAQGPAIVAPSAEQPAMPVRQKTGEPSRSLIIASHRHNRAAAEERAALPTD
jgi:hypothetical protein